MLDFALAKVGDAGDEASLLLSVAEGDRIVYHRNGMIDDRDSDHPLIGVKKMIRFKDFIPAQTTPRGLFSLGKYEDLEVAVDDANAWISAQQVDVFNVETVVLPNIDAPREEGSTDSSLSTPDGHAQWRQLVRVWYRDRE